MSRSTPMACLALVAVQAAACARSAEPGANAWDWPFHDTADWLEQDMVGGRLDDGRRFWVLTLQGSTGAATIVIAPAQGASSRYARGAPVMLAIFGDLGGASVCSAGTVPPALTMDLGAVVLQPLVAGQCCLGVCAGGSADMSGTVSQAMMGDVLAFAHGDLLGGTGLDLGGIVGMELLQDRLPLLVSSASGHLALPALYKYCDPDLPSAVALFEVPLFPHQTSRGLGAVADDDDLDLDSDGNGTAWDDMRNVRYQQGQCSGGSCRLDLSALAWDPLLAVADYGGGVFSSNLSSPGLFYLDGDADGSLALDPVTGKPDIDGDGALSSGEDFVFIGTWDTTRGTDRYWHDPQILETALDSGLLTTENWPAHLPDLQETTAFWEQRDVYASLWGLAKRSSTIRWLLVANEREHGIPIASRPHVVEEYSTLLDLGAPVLFEPSQGSFAEVLGEHVQDFPRLEEGQPLTEANVGQYLPPFDLSEMEMRTIAAAEILDWTW